MWNESEGHKLKNNEVYIHKLKIAIIGATGLVGRHFLQILGERKKFYDSLQLFASSRSIGRILEFQGEKIEVGQISQDSLPLFQNVDLILSSVPSDWSRDWLPKISKMGPVVIDNSSAWRMDPKIPLIVPEVNGYQLKSFSGNIIANPNCSTIQLVMAIKPLQILGKIQRIYVSTYQSVSGKGMSGLKELEERHTNKHGIFQNVVADDWSGAEYGYTGEEWKIMHETQKILANQEIEIIANTVRVPVEVGHCECVFVEFANSIDLEDVSRVWQNAPGIRVVSNLEGGQRAPTPRDVAGQDEVFVSRIRPNLFRKNSFVFWCVADNLRKGAATNAIQIAETLVSMGRFS